MLMVPKGTGVHLEEVCIWQSVNHSNANCLDLTVLGSDLDLRMRDKLS